MTDLFAVLGLPRRFAVDAEELRRRLYERSRLLHPDRFARATPAERRVALERAAEVNQAHRTLRDPWLRADHLLALWDGAGRTESPAVAFLEEHLAAREALSDAIAARDDAAISAVARRTADALAAMEAEVGRALAGDPPPPPALADARRLVTRARYLRSLLAQAEAADALHAPSGTGPK